MKIRKLTNFIERKLKSKPFTLVVESGGSGSKP